MLNFSFLVFLGPFAFSIFLFYHPTGGRLKNTFCYPRIRWPDPPKNGVIALWLNTSVVKCKYYVSQKQNAFNNKFYWYSILLTFIFHELKCIYSVISVIIGSLTGHTKNRESTCSWKDRVRLELGVPRKKFGMVHPAQFFIPKHGTRLFRKL